MTTSTTYGTKIEDRSLGHILYGLMSGFPLLLLPMLLSLFINLSQRPAAHHRLLQSHLRWQRHSNLIFIGLLLLGYVVPLIWLASSIYLLGSLWFCHRVIKGWLSLLDGVEM
ncbi:hypothetical protein [Shewanella sp.]|uniref:hypothetical protein n=1 Tax=Shewanella sp. TaxID=50422 RepID=UPI003F3644A8